MRRRELPWALWRGFLAAALLIQSQGVLATNGLTVELDADNWSGARSQKEGDLTPEMVDILRELQSDLDVLAERMEDALCNWQKKIGFLSSVTLVAKKL